MRAVCAYVLSAWIGVLAPVHAQDVHEILSTSEFAALCDEAIGSAHFAYCEGTLNGTASVLMLNGHLYNSGLDHSKYLLTRATVCLQKENPPNSWVKVFLDWFAANPGAGDADYSVSAVQALTAYSPCRDHPI